MFGAEFVLTPFMEIKSGLICSLKKNMEMEFLSVFISDVSPLSLDTGGPYKCCTLVPIDFKFRFSEFISFLCV